MNVHPIDRAPRAPGYVLLWRQAELVKVSERHGARDYLWVWSYHCQTLNLRPDATRLLRELVRRAGKDYAGERSGLTEYEWRGGRQITLADVRLIHLATMQSHPVEVVARIKRAATAERRERDRWLEEYAEKQRAEKRAQIERLRREIGEGA